jgi:hypothetical protein
MGHIDRLGQCRRAATLDRRRDRGDQEGQIAARSTCCSILRDGTRAGALLKRGTDAVGYFFHLADARTADEFSYPLIDMLSDCSHDHRCDPRHAIGQSVMAPEAGGRRYPPPTHDESCGSGLGSALTRILARSRVFADCDGLHLRGFLRRAQIASSPLCLLISPLGRDGYAELLIDARQSESNFGPRPQFAAYWNRDPPRGRSHAVVPPS